MKSYTHAFFRRNRLKQPDSNKRIWELDVFRGILILGVVIIHSLYFSFEFYHGILITNPVYVIIANYGGGLFVLLSGICVTLGHHPVKRGFLLVPVALLITAVTFCVDPDMTTVFGVIHLLSLCMISYPIYEHAPRWLMLILGLLIFGIGTFCELPHTKTHLLIPLGFLYPGFCTFDYFPLIPNFGYFLIGVFLGKTVYQEHKSRIPYPRRLSPLWSFLSWCGQHSLWIYLLHPPIYLGGIFLLQWLQK